MDIVAVVVAGLVATVVLTLLMYGAPLMGLSRMDMIGMMGTMFTGNKTAAYAIGTVSHFGMGVILALIYVWLWSLGLGDATWGWGVLYGAGHGLVALGSLPLMLKVHPRPPSMAMTPAVIIGMLLGHVVYGVLVALTYRALASGV